MYTIYSPSFSLVLFCFVSFFFPLLTINHYLRIFNFYNRAWMPSLWLKNPSFLLLVKQNGESKTLKRYHHHHHHHHYHHNNSTPKLIRINITYSFFLLLRFIHKHYFFSICFVPSIQHNKRMTCVDYQNTYQKNFRTWYRSTFRYSLAW